MQETATKHDDDERATIFPKVRRDCCKRVLTRSCFVNLQEIRVMLRTCEHRTKPTDSIGLTGIDGWFAVLLRK